MASKPRDLRIVALRRFATAITLFNLAGHTLLGFEQSWAQPIIALAVAYLMEIGLEALDARLHDRSPRFRGGFVRLMDFLLPAHITGLAVSMLLYPNDRLAPIVFATVIAIGSKAIVRFRQTPGKPGKKHVLNPSNTGITLTLLLFPWVGIAPPYMFTENLSGWADWLLPAVIVVSGSLLNATLTRRIPLILAWVGGFAAQALLRAMLFGTPLLVGLGPMTGVAFVLFTYYMLTDPGTTPFARRSQVVFGFAVAATYGTLMALHIVFGLFFALTIVCAGRGVILAARVVLAERAESSQLAERTVPSEPGVPVPAQSSAVARRRLAS